MVLYDNEEVGSRSLMGADSTLLGDVYQAISPDAECQRMARQKSLLLSCVGPRFIVHFIELFFISYLTQHMQ